MRTSTHILAALSATLLVAEAARAEVYVELRPRLSLLAGFDDNVELNGSGSDGFGQAAPGLKLDLFGDHQLHFGLDCQAGIARLAHPDRFGLGSNAFQSNETCLLGYRQRTSPRDSVQVNARATYAQDPFAIAGLGLLLRPGQTQVFVAKLGTEWQHALTPSSRLDFFLDGTALEFGAGDPGNGYMLQPQLRWVKRTTPRVTWDLGLREQLFLAPGESPNPRAPNGAPGGLLNEVHAGTVGWTYQLAQDANVVLRGGPLLVTGRNGQTWMPTARFELNRESPWWDLRMVVGHDLVIGPSGAGPLVGDIAEVGGMLTLGHWDGHARFGAYRNASIAQATSVVGSVGYGAELAVDYLLTKEWRLGAAALRDARLHDETVIAQQVDRNVFQLRLTWEKARF